MFIFLERDSFESQSRLSGGQALETQKVLKEDAAIRRPYRGIQIKDDTYAVLSVRRPTGEPIPLASSSAVPESAQTTGGMGRVSEYSDFILQQVQDQRMERQQIIETFGDTFVYFFGERPRMVTFSGQLMNTEDFNWRAQFWYNYENYLRGSKLVQLNARCYLAYDTLVIEGYPLSAVAVDDADSPYQVSFSMTMLMTDYHEYSVIGETRFPGVRAESLEILNQALEESRKKFVSTTLAVRRENMTGSLSSQLPQTNSALALLRSGVQAWNSAATWLGDKLDIANRLLGGRTLRMPIGAASFLTLSAEGEIAASSANIVSVGTSSFDVATGDRFGSIEVNGVLIPGNKLTIMGPAKFAPSWVSAVTNTSRGMIYENYDEYPTRTLPTSLKDLLTKSQYAKVMSDAEGRNFFMRAFQQQLALFNIRAAAGDLLSTISSVVSAVREGYGMLLTAANFVENPLGVVTSAIGITPQNVKMIGDGLKDGAFIPGVSMFVGGAARRTWEGWLDRVGDAKIGDVFKSVEYTPNAASRPNDASYDLAYGGADYSGLIESQENIDESIAEAEADLPNDIDRTEPNADKIALTLDEVYGNTDSSDNTEQGDSPDSLAYVYGQNGTIQSTALSAERRSLLLQEAYNGNVPVSDTDTSGITAEDADGAPIDPVV